MTPDIEPTKDTAPVEVVGCFGLCCHEHATCKLYYAVNGLKKGRIIDTCGLGLDRPRYLEVTP